MERIRGTIENWLGIGDETIPEATQEEVSAAIAEEFGQGEDVTLDVFETVQDASQIDEASAEIVERAISTVSTDGDQDRRVVMSG